VLGALGFVLGDLYFVLCIWCFARMFDLRTDANQGTKIKAQRSKYQVQILHAVGLEPTELNDGASDLQSGAFATRHTHAQELCFEL
jgi:hypothetical protein